MHINFFVKDIRIWMLSNFPQNMRINDKLDEKNALNHDMYKNDPLK